jgi:hypothetical protein
MRSLDVAPFFAAEAKILVSSGSEISLTFLRMLNEEHQNLMTNFIDLQDMWFDPKFLPKLSRTPQADDNSLGLTEPPIPR